jgi:glutaredoxin 3
MNTTKRKIEVFSAGCSVCHETIELVKQLACSSCEVEIHDMHKPEVAERAKAYGVQRVPAVVINGKLASCCTGNMVSADTLRREGVGVAL